MSYATLAYIPPARLNADAFVRNVLHFQSEYPVIWYSDHPYPDLEVIEVPDPTSIKLSRNPVALHNRIFLHGLTIAQNRKLKRFIYLESDCRVHGDGWDKRIFEEAAPHPDMFMAGTPALYNQHRFANGQKLSVTSATDAYELSTGLKVPVYNARVHRPLGCWFIMGGGSVLNTAIAADVMMGFERDSHQKAIRIPAFDLFIGLRCFQLFGALAPQKLPFLPSVFSSFGDSIKTEAERIEMVKSGSWACVHQIKTNTDCL